MYQGAGCCLYLPKATREAVIKRGIPMSPIAPELVHAIENARRREADEYRLARMALKATKQPKHRPAQSRWGFRQVLRRIAFTP